VLVDRVPVLCTVTVVRAGVFLDTACSCLHDCNFSDVNLCCFVLRLYWSAVLSGAADISCETAVVRQLFTA
jgi:hypothetical protein